MQFRSNGAHNARHCVLLLVRVVSIVGSLSDHSQILRRVIPKPITGRRVDTDVLSRILWVCRQESHVLHRPFLRAGGGVDKSEDNGSILNHAGRAGNILSISIVDVLQIQLSVLYARWVRVVIVGKADVISVDILEVVADDDTSNEQIDFTVQAILASPLDVELGSCACQIVYGKNICMIMHSGLRRAEDIARGYENLHARVYLVVQGVPGGQVGPRFPSGQALR